jgi:hypothetical protein
MLANDALPRYDPAMRQLARQFFSILLALAFFGAVLERSALGNPDEPCPLSSHPEHVGHGSYAAHHHHHTGKQDQSPAQICLKCCGLCTADAYIAPAPLLELDGLAMPILFSADLDSHIGRPVVLDPGIPKRTA